MDAIIKTERALLLAVGPSKSHVNYYADRSVAAGRSARFYSKWFAPSGTTPQSASLTAPLSGEPFFMPEKIPVFHQTLTFLWFFL